MQFEIDISNNLSINKKTYKTEPYRFKYLELLTDYFCLCLFLRNLFLRLCVDILLLFFFFPLGITQTLIILHYF
jgi:hypothetical protein